MKWDSVIKAFDTIDSCFKTESCGSCNYNNIGIGLCDTCTNARFPLRDSENHHSDNYYTKEYDRIMKEVWEEDMYEYDWFGFVKRKKG